FSPKYLSPWYKMMRPTIEELPEKINYGDTFDIDVTGVLPMLFGYPEVNIASAPFATHSFSQGQRLVKLAVLSRTIVGLGTVRLECLAPPDGSVAPPG
nr:aldehyde oxidase GLOX [Tanacetum cinerariifolium]